MAHHRLAGGLGIASILVAALVAHSAFRVPERPQRAVACPATPTAEACRPIPVPPPAAPAPVQPLSTTDANEEVEFADEELDQDAALESALLTLIRARGRGTDARR